MPKDKTASHIQVMAAVKEEFLEKGFEAASVRSIAARAGMSAAGLYRHYANKEAMFEDLVQPLIQEMEEWVCHHKEKAYARMQQGDEGKHELFGESMIDLIRDVVYPQREIFQVLLCGASGSRYENFMHDYVDAQQQDMITAFSYMKEHGYAMEEISQEELHMLLSAYTTAIFEPILHNYSEEQMNHCLDTVNRFFMPGWKEIMGF